MKKTVKAWVFLRDDGSVGADTDKSCSKLIADCFKYKMIQGTITYTVAPKKPKATKSKKRVGK